MRLWVRGCAVLLILLSRLTWADEAPETPSQPEARLSIRLRPNNAELERNIEAHIGSLGPRDQAALQRYARTAVQQATQALQALGYYQGSIQSRVKPGKEAPELHLSVRQGRALVLDAVRIEISGSAAQQKEFRTPSGAHLRVGDTLNQGRYDEAKQAIVNQALHYGYFDGHFVRNQLRVDPPQGSAQIDLRYASGPRYRFGRVSFVGDQPISEELLHRLQPFREGDPFDADQLARFSQNLTVSGFFSEVRVDGQSAQRSAQQVPVEVHLNPVLPRSFTFGLGFSTDIGPRGRVGWARHWRNPQGHSLGVDGEVSGPKQSIGSWYQIPLENALTDRLRFTSQYQQEQLADAQSQKLSLGSQWQQKLDSSWLRSLSLNWQHERFDYGRASPEGISNLLLAGIGFNRREANSATNPTRGWSLQTQLQGAKKGLLADNDLAQITSQAKGLYSFANDQRLLGRLELGAVATGDYQNVPPSLRFFTGGDQSVRGYDYQSLSPTDKQGNKVGGRYLLAGSLEYQYPVLERWHVAAFVDRGMAFDNPNAALKTGAGLGLRWLSPVGPIRLDLAHALDEPGGVRLHFSMGPEL